MSNEPDDAENPELADEILASIQRPPREELITRARPKPLDNPADRKKRARADEAELSVKLQRRLANAAIWIMCIQLGLADVGFALYGNANDWHIPPAAIIAWLSATVIEVIGLIVVITNRLFPSRKARK